jgi:hypothetical protein
MNFKWQPALPLVVVPVFKLKRRGSQFQGDQIEILKNSHFLGKKYSQFTNLLKVKIYNNKKLLTVV